jgi:hypothetical protein
MCRSYMQTLLTFVAGQFVISDKMVSRRHLTVEVDEVRPSDCVRNPGNKILP